MTNEFVRLLLVEDNPGDARLIQEAIEEAAMGMFHLKHVQRLSEAMQAIADDPPDVVLLDLFLPDSAGLQTFFDLYAAAPEVPIILLTGLNDEEIAMTAVREGAQDYLIKGQVDGQALVRAARYAIERHRSQAALRRMSMHDELTGLYNRRAFMEIAAQRLNLAQREGKTIVFLFVDLDGMKWINDTLGHQEGDRALIEVSDLLRTVFRTSDLIARIGGDEFVVLALVDSPADAEQLCERLQYQTSARNRLVTRPYQLSLSIGAVVLPAPPPGEPIDVEQLLRKADALMYQAKKYKGAPRKTA